MKIGKTTITVAINPHALALPVEIIADKVNGTHLIAVRVLVIIIAAAW
jgi:hypothetical protein